MSKIDKKIISIFLVLIILISQFSMVFAETSTTGQTLKEYLAKRDIDLDNPEDCAEIKRLNLRTSEINDFSGLEKAVNLESLYIGNYSYNSTAFDVSSIDFSKLTNLKSLGFSNCDLSGVDFSKLTNLRSLSLDGCDNISTINFSNLENLLFLDIYDCNEEKLNFTGMNSLTSLNVSGIWGTPWMPELTGIDTLTNLEQLQLDCAIEKIDVSNLLNLETLYIYQCFGDFAKFPNSENSKLSNVEIHHVNGNVDLSKNLSIESVNIAIEDYRNLKLPSNLEVLVTDNYDYVERKDYVESRENVLPEKITILKGEEYTLYTEFDVNLNSSNIEIIEKLDYMITVQGKETGNAKLLVKDDANVEHEIDVIVEENNYDRPLEETGITAEFVDDNKILKSNGELWKVNSETTAKKIDENVDKYISTAIYSYDYNILSVELTLKDGMLEIENYSGAEENSISNVKDIATTNYGENTIYLTNTGDVYEIEWNYITDKITHNKIMTNVSELNNVGGKNFYTWGYLLQLKEDGIVYSYESGNPILNHVSQISEDIIIRKDGTIWIYSETNGLVKAENSSSSDEEDKPVEKEYIENKSLKTKTLVTNKTAITGIEPKTNVGSLKAGNNFVTGCIVKVFNTKNEEVSDTANLGTGNIIRLYEGEKLVKEYIVVIYGDTNGDGLIGAIDALGIVLNKNGKIPFKDITFVEAGRIKSLDGQTPAAVDGLAIIRHIMGKELINQTK